MITRISLEKTGVIIILSLILLSGEIVPSGIAFSLSGILLILLAIKFHKINLTEIIIVLPLLLILLIGIISSLFQDVYSTPEKFYLVGKDIWYFIKPVLYILTGFYICRYNLKKEVFLSIILYASIIVSIHHIVKVIVFVTTAGQESLVLDIIRYETGPGNLLEVFSLAYVLKFFKTSEIKKHILIPRWILILIFSVSIILSFSRTLILALILILLAMQNFFSFSARTFLKSLIITVFLFITISLVMVYFHKVSEKDSVIYDLTDKYLNSFREITYEEENPTFEDINKNWRGLETNKAITEFRKGNILERIFGFGFGKTVYIGYSGLRGIVDPNIPRFHNGFVEILLKTGFLGMIFYILFFYFAFRVADKDYSRKEANILLKAVLVTSFIVTLVITGLYNKSALDPYLLMSGYLMGISTGINDC